MKKIINWFTDSWIKFNPKLKKGGENKLNVDIQELLTQTLINIRYINASINTIRVNINGVKGDGPSETRSKRKILKNQLSWFEKKLVEETGMANHYSELLGKKTSLNE